MITKESLRKIKGDFQGYACKFSPYYNDLIACATSQYYGIIGNGKIMVYRLDNEGIKAVTAFDTNDGIFDLAWSESNKDHLISAGADGSLKLWDITKSSPLFSVKEHKGEIWSVAWNHLQSNLIASSSTDTTINIFDLVKGLSINRLSSHSQVAYSATWHPTIDSVVASASADATCKLYDVKSGRIVKQYNHSTEVMKCEFNKYDSLIAVASADGLIYLYDLRGGSNQPLKVIKGHQLTVRNIVFSPFDRNVLYSVGYDMNVIVWDLLCDLPMKIYKEHSEFVYGLDCSLFDKGVFASIAWDNYLNVYM